MIITFMQVDNFRNIKSAEFVFSPHINIIGGNNAQGKTNLMEAVAVCVERSFRNPKLNAFINKDFTGDCGVTIVFTVDKYPEKENSLIFKTDGVKVEKTVNDINYKEGIKLYPQLKTIVFIPEDLYIIKGDPENRRELADDTAHMMNKQHRNICGEYLRALKQKNTFISSLRGERPDQYQKLQLSIWNESLAKAGVNVICGRRKYFYTLSKYAAEFYSELNQNNEKLRMEYKSSIMEESDFESAPPERLLELYLERLEQAEEREILAGHTLVGVHRDDIEFLIDENPAHDFASQGQVRSAAVAIRLAQAKMFGEKWGEPPVIILDDVLSELDEKRREFILKHTVNSQVFITGCNRNDFKELKNAKRWEAENGKFRTV